MMILGYNTNGFAHHTLEDATSILARLGYGAVGLTLERACLDPPDGAGVEACVRRIAPLLESTGLRATIETGARFILDPWRKHQPTLLSAQPQDARKRAAFLKAAIDIASSLRADSVSLWSGTPDDNASEQVLWNRMTQRLIEVVDYAANRDVRITLEPEPGMFINTMNRFAELTERMEHKHLGLTLDIGHLMCLDDGDINGHLERWRDRLWNVHIEDMREGVHEHLMFGAGTIDFIAVFQALNGIGYAGPLHVELSRHSHLAVDAARRSFAFLKAFLQGEPERPATERRGDA